MSVIVFYLQFLTDIKLAVIIIEVKPVGGHDKQMEPSGLPTGATWAYRSHRKSGQG